MLRSQVESVAVIVHDSQVPNDDEWAAWVREYRVIAGKLRAILVYSLGGGPNGKQRGDLTAIFPELSNIPHTYIVTSSVAMRGIVTAIGWFLPQDRRVKTYPITELSRALADINVSPRGSAEITRVIQAHLETFGRATRRAG
jgi:hypothetical protein